MEKKVSFLWALVVGVASPILQVLIYFLRFGTLNPDAKPADYLFFFIGGAFIGVALVYFLRRSESKTVFRGTLVGFAIGIPFAAIGMMFGGFLAPVASLFLGVSPGVFAILVGFFLGRLIAKDDE